MTTIMHPFQCGLQPQIQEAHRTTNTDTTTRCRTQRRNQSRPERPQPHVPHTRGTFFVGCNHFTRKNTRFRAPASSPKQSPGNIHAAITIRFAASRSKPASLYTHGNTRRAPNSNAVCNHRFKKPIELRTQTQPLVAEHRGGNQFASGTTAATRAAHMRYLSSPDAATLHGKTQGFVLRLPPQTKPRQHSCSYSNAICNHRFKKLIELCAQEQPLVAEHRGGTKPPQPQPPHTGGTFHRRPKPLYTENHAVSCSGFLPKP